MTTILSILLQVALGAIARHGSRYLCSKDSITFRVADIRMLRENGTHVMRVWESMKAFTDELGRQAPALIIDTIVLQWEDHPANRSVIGDYMDWERVRDFWKNRYNH